MLLVDTFFVLFDFGSFIAIVGYIMYVI